MREIVEWAEQAQIPFKLLGRDESGVDCAGATKLLYAKGGRQIRVQDCYPPYWWRRDPFKIVRWVDRVLGWKRTSEVQPMDLLVLGLHSIADHVGVYAGGGRFIHMSDRLVVSSLGDLTGDQAGSTTWAMRIFGAYRPEG